MFYSFEQRYYHLTLYQYRDTLLLREEFMQNAQVRPVRDLRNRYTEIEALIENHDPVIITKNTVDQSRATFLFFINLKPCWSDSGDYHLRVYAWYTSNIKEIPLMF